MATKSYTDISQSRKLAEILPLESADMYYHYNTSVVKNYHEDIPNVIQLDNHFAFFNDDIPCWSLAALFGVLPMIKKGKDIANPFIARTPDEEYYVVYATSTKEIDSSGTYDNPVDACYEMIEHLHKLNLL